MALNLSDRLAVMASGTMQARCTGAVAKYALYILGESDATANHANRLAWAREAIRDPAGTARTVSYHVLDDTNFLSGGSDITDELLGGAIETAVNNRFIQAAS